MMSAQALSHQEVQVLADMADGATLKVHRTLEGDKEYRLHPLGAAPSDVPAPLVMRLLRRGILQSNMKFPAATFVLTERGQRAVTQLLGTAAMPVASRSFSPDDHVDI